LKEKSEPWSPSKKNKPQDISGRPADWEKTRRHKWKKTSPVTGAGVKIRPEGKKKEAERVAKKLFEVDQKGHVLRRPNPK